MNKKNALSSNVFVVINHFHQRTSSQTSVFVHICSLNYLEHTQTLIDHRQVYLLGCYQTRKKLDSFLRLVTDILRTKKKQLKTFVRFSIFLPYVVIPLIAFVTCKH